MKNKASTSEFKEKLDQQHSWPSLYMFKFIVPRQKEGEIQVLFPYNELTTKESAGGKYVSVTAKVMMGSSDEVIRIYEEAYKVEGVISL